VTDPRGQRPSGADDNWRMPVNPCVACFRQGGKLSESQWIAVNRIRRITLCEKCKNEFQEADRDRADVDTSYIPITPGQVINIGPNPRLFS